VAFLISQGAVVIDFCGPWECSEQRQHRRRKDAAFHLYTVGGDDEPGDCERGHENRAPIQLATAPAPKIIVIPARMSRVKRRSSGFAQRSKATTSRCRFDRAFVLAKTAA